MVVNCALSTGSQDERLWGPPSVGEHAVMHCHEQREIVTQRKVSRKKWRQGSTRCDRRAFH